MHSQLQLQLRDIDAPFSKSQYDVDGFLRFEGIKRNVRRERSTLFRDVVARKSKIVAESRFAGQTVVIKRWNESYFNT